MERLLDKYRINDNLAPFTSQGVARSTSIHYHNQTKFGVVYSDRPVILSDYATDFVLYNRVSDRLAELPATIQLSGSHRSKML